MGMKCQLWIGTSTRDRKKGLGSYFKYFLILYDTLRPFPQKVPNCEISGLLLSCVLLNDEVQGALGLSNNVIKLLWALLCKYQITKPLERS